MLFNSEIFLFAFLPLTLIVFYALGSAGRARSALASLVLASLVYYGWWNPAYLPLILGSMLVNFVLGRGIGVSRETRPARARVLLVFGVAFNLGLLGYFKYANFFVDNLAAATGLPLEMAPVLLPLGISFFTFQQIAYLSDMREGRVGRVDLLGYALFVTFFPQLIAGPIVHHSEMMPQFADRRIGRFRLQDLLVGSAFFFLGLFKKVVLADSIAPFASTVFDGAAAGNAIGFADAWTGALAYTFQIYFDFSGYSDMAVGLARMFGINLPLNFNSPYKASGIIEFWRRWHMTLSRFLRDYLYIPLGGNRLGSGRRYVNMMIVMLLGGLWHGAGWDFVVWGGLHGLYLGVNHAWRAWRGERRSDGFAARAGATALTFVAVVVAWVFFRAESFDAARTIITAMADLGTLSAPSALAASFTLEREVFAWFAVFALIVWLLPNTQQYMRDWMDRDRYRIRPPAFLGNLTWGLAPRHAVHVALIATVTIMLLWQPSEFIYYQF